MKSIYRILIGYAIMLCPCQASLFEATLEQDALYSPATIRLPMSLTNNAEIQGTYQFKVSIFLIGTLVRQETLQSSNGIPLAYELEIPEVLDRTEGRCRVELSLQGDFLEAREIPFTVWPPLKSDSTPINHQSIWVFDTSGRVQKLCNAMNIRFVDATFQAAREFGTPTIVLIGEDIPPSHIPLVTEHVKSVVPAPVQIFLRQRQFPRELKLQVSDQPLEHRSLQCDKNTRLLKGLTYHDLTALLAESIPIQIDLNKDDPRQIQSHITDKTHNAQTITTYLCTVHDRGRTMICCQLPISNPTPRSAYLLTHLLHVAADVTTQERK